MKGANRILYSQGELTQALPMPKVVEKGRITEERLQKKLKITVIHTSLRKGVTMSSSTLIEVFGYIVFSFTRGMTEHYNPEGPDFTAESFGYNPLESTGREWYYRLVDELIYQEYSDREATSWDYLVSSRFDVRIINACSPEDNEEPADEDQQDEDRAMAWKRLRPSALRTLCKSMYIGALTSLLAAVFIGSVYILISYISYKTTYNCNYHSKSLNSNTCAMAQNRFNRDPLRLYLYLVLCTHTVSFSPISVNGFEKKTVFGLFPYILFGCILSYCSTVLREISFQTFHLTTDSV